MTSTACDDQFTTRPEVPKKEQQVTSNLKEGIHRDRDYLDHLRTLPCFITGTHSHDNEVVVPAHTGNSGRGIKAPDKHSLPMMASLHTRSHDEGVLTFWLDILAKNPVILNELLTNYAENVYFKQYEEESK